MKIVLSGPDGTGKSTIVAQLSQSLAKEGSVKCSWRRFGFVSARAVNLVGRLLRLSVREKTPFGVHGYHDYRGLFGKLYVLAIWLDYKILIKVKWEVRDIWDPSSYQVIDRYLVDIIADAIISTGDARFVLGLFRREMSKHIRTHNCIVLYCSTNVVSARRPDL